MALEPQAALEQAVLAAIQAAPLGGFTWTSYNSGRTFDGEPPPRCGNYWLSIWSRGDRTSEAKTSLNEMFKVFATLTIRATQPYDRLLAHRDDLEAKLNRISALIHQDVWSYTVSRAADTLASLDGSGQPVGYREGLMFEGYDPVELKGGAWFHADPAKTEVGLAQTARFGKCRRVRAVVTAD